ncbi:hypothetical protein BDW66DRAFT_133511 [Aspergillus desertorum]
MRLSGIGETFYIARRHIGYNRRKFDYARWMVLLFGRRNQLGSALHSASGSNTGGIWRSYICIHLTALLLFNTFTINSYTHSLEGQRK